MLVTEFESVILDNKLQPLNADMPILVTVDGITIEVKLLQVAKVLALSVVIVFGILTDVIIEQPLNADAPILVTEFEILADFSFEQFVNADAPMLVTESGIITLDNAVQPLNADAPMLVIFGPSVKLVKTTLFDNILAGILPA